MYLAVQVEGEEGEQCCRKLGEWCGEQRREKEGDVGEEEEAVR
jgi:hypothetical protein